MQYGNTHKFFLRTMMSKGVMSERDAQKLILQHADGGDWSVSDVVRAINTRVRPFCQELKRTHNELTGEPEIVMLWTGVGLAERSQVLHSELDLEFWRKLMEEIVSADGKKIDGISAMNLDPRISKTRAQDLMNNWLNAHYLTKLDTGEYILGSRAIHEFESYISQNLPSVLDPCMLCNKSVFQSISCNHCGEYFHLYCIKKSMEKMKKWPCCMKTDADLEF